MQADREVDVDDLCFTARALAQTHPMSEGALRYRQRCFEQERDRQPVPEIADWASTALLVGYCLRRAEEREVLGEAAPGIPDDAAVSEAALADATATLRTGDASTITLLEAPTTLASLDRLIATELDKRREHLREQLDDDEWLELEDYISWWVVHGFCVRATEVTP